MLYDLFEYEGFYTPFGVRWFGTGASLGVSALQAAFLYALRREVVRNTGSRVRPRSAVTGFYTPFGVRWFGTLPPWTGR